jgi:hypothetical protein
MRSLRYLNGGTSFPFPAEAEQFGLQLLEDNFDFLGFGLLRTVGNQNVDV